MKSNKPDSPVVEDTRSSLRSGTVTQVAKGRRAALAKAGVTGGAIAGGVWAKPMINSTVLPAHAATTDSGGDPGEGTTTTIAPSPISMTGPTAPVEYLASTGANAGSQNLIARAVDSVVPRANAFNGAVPARNARFGAYQGAAGLCVTLQFPQGNTPSGPVNVTVQGPRHYSLVYSYNSSEGQYVYSSPFEYQISGNGSGTLGGPEGLDFSVNLGQVTVEGCVTSSDFSGAEGVVVANQQLGDGFLPGVDRTYYESSGYGASFDASPNTPCRTGYGFNPVLD
ncbi:MAG: hypothetical protein AAF402_05350 [Pseudomonadota bacterium]